MQRPGLRLAVRGRGRRASPLTVGVEANHDVAAVGGDVLHHRAGEAVAVAAVHLDLEVVAGRRVQLGVEADAPGVRAVAVEAERDLPGRLVVDAVAVGIVDAVGDPRPVAAHLEEADLGAIVLDADDAALAAGRARRRGGGDDQIPRVAAAAAAPDQAASDQDAAEKKDGVSAAETTLERLHGGTLPRSARASTQPVSASSAWKCRPIASAVLDTLARHASIRSDGMCTSKRIL